MVEELTHGERNDDLMAARGPKAVVSASFAD